MHSIIWAPVSSAYFSINLMRDLDLALGKELAIALPADRIRVYGRDG